jgi:uncharacterized BrkB/YihY/UPF0761 family membrane protein
MNLSRNFAYFIGILALVLSVFIYLEYIYMLGFPDGFITELENAQKHLAYVFISVDILLAFCFIYLGNLAKKQEINKKLVVAIATYLICIIVTYCINYYYQLNLTDSRGG